jgi:hypothetical protein
MPTTILKHIKGSEMPKAWLKKLKAEPDKIFTVTIEEIQTLEIEEDMPMPPEEMISEKLIKAVQESEKQCLRGEGTLCKTKEERKAFFKSVWND